MRVGITTVLIPKDNEKELEEIPDNVKRNLTIIPVSTVDEVLAKALVKPLVPILKEEEEEDEQSSSSKDTGGDEEPLLTH